VDWNWDGLKDIITGEADGNVRFFKNVGVPAGPQLTFDSYIQFDDDTLDVGNYSTPWVDDWNEDGLNDLLVGEEDGKVFLYINVGSNEHPVFDVEDYLYLSNNDVLDFGFRSSPIVVDLDGDGDKDVASGDNLGKLYFCENHGTNADPQLSAPVALCTGTTTIIAGGTTRLAPIDWDFDGDVDLMVGNWYPRLQIFLQIPETAPAPEVILQNNGGWIIPPSGGIIDYTLGVDNQTASAATVDVWTEVKMPINGFYGPLVYRPDVTVPSITSVSRNLIQNVPGSAPYGDYELYGYVGDFDQLQIYSWAYFNFIKMIYSAGGNAISDWYCSGWDQVVAGQRAAALPERVEVSASPNPFNPATTIRFTLPQATPVNLSIYDISGRLVSPLLDGFRAAGTHEVTFDASGFPSGIYFARIEAGDFAAIQKLVLLK
jgi:hypothetical protein